MVKVSIIIPTRNRSSYLQRSLEHAFAQDYPNLEVIVSDNASTDDTDNVLKELKIKHPKLICVRHYELLPLSVHWDKVIREVSTGDIILLIPDDDVIVVKDYISKAIRLFRKYPTIGLVFANYYIVNQDFLRIRQIEAQFEEFIPKEFLFENYNNDLFGIKGIGVSHLTTLFLKKAYTETEGFDFECMCPDTYLWLKILLTYDASFIKEKVAEYLIHENNLSKTGSIEQIYSDTLIPLKIKQYATAINKSEPFIQETINRMDEIFYKRFQNIFLKALFQSKLEIKYLRYIRISAIVHAVYKRFMK
jgi:glycosyltransferase involved in cell wall biosynthesis